MIDYYTLIPNFKKLIPQFLDRKNTFAVVGNFQKSGHSLDVLKNLEEAKYKIEIIDPKCKEVDENKCYPSLKELPKPPDVVCITTPSNETEGIVKECLEIGIKKVWIEPGSESDESVEFCKRYYIKEVYHHSIIKERVNPCGEEEFLKKYDI